MIVLGLIAGAIAKAIAVGQAGRRVRICFSVSSAWSSKKKAGLAPLSLHKPLGKILTLTWPYFNRWCSYRPVDLGHHHQEEGTVITWPNLPGEASSLTGPRCVSRITRRQDGTGGHGV